ncbi:MAG: permease [Chloroflexota bacterium]
MNIITLILMHPARLGILDLLREGEACVCHMEAVFGYRQAYISQQLMVLRDAGKEILSMQTELTKREKEQAPLSSADWRAWGLVALVAVLWFALYNVIQPFANWLAYGLLALPKDSHLGESLAFFFYDAPKIILLLGGMIFLITTLRSFFSPEQTRAWLGGKREGVGNLLAASLGVVTPFCSCSAALY